eukprot:Rmarinus@m.9456
MSNPHDNPSLISALAGASPEFIRGIQARFPNEYADQLNPQGFSVSRTCEQYVVHHPYGRAASQWSTSVQSGYAANAGPFPPGSSPSSHPMMPMPLPVPPPSHTAPSYPMLSDGHAQPNSSAGLPNFRTPFGRPYPGSHAHQAHDLQGQNYQDQAYQNHSHQGQDQNHPQRVQGQGYQSNPQRVQEQGYPHRDHQEYSPDIGVSGRSHGVGKKMLGIAAAAEPTTSTSPSTSSLQRPLRPKRKRPYSENGDHSDSTVSSNDPESDSSHQRRTMKFPQPKYRESHHTENGKSASHFLSNEGRMETREGDPAPLPPTARDYLWTLRGCSYTYTFRDFYEVSLKMIPSAPHSRPPSAEDLIVDSWSCVVKSDSMEREDGRGRSHVSHVSHVAGIIRSYLARKTEILHSSDSQNSQNSANSAHGDESALNISPEVSAEKIQLAHHVIQNDRKRRAVTPPASSTCGSRGDYIAERRKSVGGRCQRAAGGAERDEEGPSGDTTRNGVSDCEVSPPAPGTIVSSPVCGRRREGDVLRSLETVVDAVEAVVTEITHMMASCSYTATLTWRCRECERMTCRCQVCGAMPCGCHGCGVVASQNVGVSSNPTHGANGSAAALDVRSLRTCTGKENGTCEQGVANATCDNSASTENVGATCTCGLCDTCQKNRRRQLWVDVTFARLDSGVAFDVGFLVDTCVTLPRRTSPCIVWKLLPHVTGSIRSEDISEEIAVLPRRNRTLSGICESLSHLLPRSSTTVG